MLPLCLRARVFEKLILAIPGKCQHFQSNFMLTLSLKLVSRILFSASPKENTEMSFASSEWMGFLEVGNKEPFRWQF